MFFSDHGEHRRHQLGVREPQIEEALRESEIIETYPDTGRSPSYLLLHWTDEAPIHVVAADKEGFTLIVTVYDSSTEPDEWTNDYSQRLRTTMNPTPRVCSACIARPVPMRERDTTTMTLERDETTLVVKHVPAYVCPYCGDATLGEEMSEWLDDAMDAAEAAGGTTVRAYDLEEATM